MVQKTYKNGVDNESTNNKKTRNTRVSFHRLGEEMRRTVMAMKM
jgi:hypothetical protein